MPPHPTPPPPTTTASAVHRFEVRFKPSLFDPHARSLIAEAQSLGIKVAEAASARIYLIDGPLNDQHLDRIGTELLADPVTELVNVGSTPARETAHVIEIHPLPGVMDPAAQSVASAIHNLTGIKVQVRTATRFDLVGISRAQADLLAQSVLANPIIHAIHDHPYLPDALPEGQATEFQLGQIQIRDLDDEQLAVLSRDGHLFLSLDEMRTIRDFFQDLGREPTDIELETLAQTWSEHCVHKTLKSTILYTQDNSFHDAIDWTDRPGHTVNPDGSITINNLLRSTVAAATHELITDGVDWTQSVFVDNAGIIAFDDELSVCIKVETHNHPSALDPYGGAATGIGGCIRDIMGTGLVAKPIASTNVFCVAPPDIADVPAGCIHPRHTLEQVVAGVRDYGNRMGIPTVNGAVAFDERFVGNPLVFCGCIGTLPSNLIAGDANPGDHIIALGGSTGRDGIHGATFSSAELTDSHADEFSHAVQIGNAIEEKRVLDAILKARDAQGGPLFSSVTDCGAGGFSSAVGEMGETIGAMVHLDKAPLKYEGLSYTEIWISEAQERMVLAVPEKNIPALQDICDVEHVQMADLGTFGTPDCQLILNYQNHQVGCLPMSFLHDGIPTPTRKAHWQEMCLAGHERRADNLIDRPEDRSLTVAARKDSNQKTTLNEALLRLLADPDIASKHWIIQQYDHEVQGNTVIKPLVGPRGIGPSDAAVVEPNPGTGRGLAIASGLATGIGDPTIGGDPYQAALSGIDECVRNLVCVGADPARIAILDNFCWPSCDDPANLASLVRACEGCYDAAMVYRTPFVSGKDSLNNQFTKDDGQTIRIPPTLLITGIGIVQDLVKIVTSDIKSAANLLILVQPAGDSSHENLHKLGGSHYARLFGFFEDHQSAMPEVDLIQCNLQAQCVARAISLGLVRSCHDVSDGGLLCTLAEMLIAGSTSTQPIGASIEMPESIRDETAFEFGQRPGSYLLEIEPGARNALESIPGINLLDLGTTTDSGVLEIRSASGNTSLQVDQLTLAWRSTLDW